MNVLNVWLSLAVFATVGASILQSAPLDIEALPSIPQLPDPFLRDNGQRIHAPSDWKAQRKALLEKVLQYEYGPLPPAPRNVKGSQVSSRKIDDIDAEERVIVLSMGPRGSVHTHITLTLPEF